MTNEKKLDLIQKYEDLSDEEFKESYFEKLKRFASDKDDTVKAFTASVLSRFADTAKQQEAIDILLQLCHERNALARTEACNGVQREHNKKLNNGLPILHKVPPKRDYGRYFCIMAEKGGTSHGGLTEKLSPFFHAKKQEVNAYGR